MSLNDRRIWVNLSMMDARPGGVGRYSLKLLQELNRRPISRRMTLLLPSGLDELRSGPFSEFEIASIDRKLRGDLYPKTAPFYRFAWNRFSLSRWVGKRDLIYAPSSHGSISCAPQTIFTVHDTLALAFPSQHRLQNLYFKSRVSQMAKNAKALISVSEFSASEIRTRFQLPPERVIHIVPPAVDLDVLPESWGGIPDRFFLVVGATYPHKNIDTVLEALRSDSCASMKLLIAGAGLSYGHRLREKVASDPVLSQRVLWAPYLSDAQIRYVFSKAEALLFPSVYEGFGMPVAEAIQWGVRVLASDIAVVRECFGSYVERLPPLRVDAWIEAMIRVWGSNSRPVAQLVSRWSDSADRLEAVLNEALDR
jgi:glycosyltransferase involved in cell wall biosynthesis